MVGEDEVGGGVALPASQDRATHEPSPAVSALRVGIASAEAWADEPDRLSWEHDGIQCRIFRHPGLGHLCGYVGVPAGHPWHGLHYDAVEPCPDVHGGLTYANPNAPFDQADDLWWLGFDCAHAGDLVPSLPYHDPDDTYKTIAFVQGEVISLAAQAIEARQGGNSEAGSVHESAVGEADASNTSPVPHD